MYVNMFKFNKIGIVPVQFRNKNLCLLKEKVMFSLIYLFHNDFL